MIAQLFGLLGTAGLCALLGACLYESVVMAPNYASQAPASLLHIRAFFRARTPAHFFRIAAPLTVLLLVVGIMLAWHLLPARWLYLAALVIFVAAEAVTFVVHYPCNKVLFLDPLSDDTALLARTAWEWARWNWVRAALLGLAIASLAGGVLSITDNFQQ